MESLRVSGDGDHARQSSKWKTFAMMRHRPSTNTKLRKSVKDFAPIVHSTRARAVTGPANSIDRMRSARGSPRRRCALIDERKILFHAEMGQGSFGGADIARIGMEHLGQPPGVAVVEPVEIARQDLDDRGERFVHLHDADADMARNLCISAHLR
jgi:hypothetical protein